MAIAVQARIPGGAQAAEGDPMNSQRPAIGTDRGGEIEAGVLGIDLLEALGGPGPG